VTTHAEYALRGSCIAEVFDLALAISAAEARRAEGLISCQNSQVFNLVAASAAAIRAIVAYQRAIAQEEKVCV